MNNQINETSRHVGKPLSEHNDYNENLLYKDNQALIDRYISLSDEEKTLKREQFISDALFINGIIPLPKGIDSIRKEELNDKFYEQLFTNPDDAKALARHAQLFLFDDQIFVDSIEDHNLRRKIRVLYGNAFPEDLNILFTLFPRNNALKKNRMAAPYYFLKTIDNFLKDEFQEEISFKESFTEIFGITDQYISKYLTRQILIDYLQLKDTDDRLRDFQPVYETISDENKILFIQNFDKALFYKLSVLSNPALLTNDKWIQEYDNWMNNEFIPFSAKTEKTYLSEVKELMKLKPINYYQR